MASALDILVSPAKVDEPIEMLFVGQTRVGQRNRAFDKDAHWRHLAITTERSVHSGDVALRCWEKNACLQCCDAVGLVAGRASGLQKTVMGCWCGSLSGARCRLAYGPADATATHCLVLQ